MQTYKHTDFNATSTRDQTPFCPQVLYCTDQNEERDVWLLPRQTSTTKRRKVTEGDFGEERTLTKPHTWQTPPPKQRWLTTRQKVTARHLLVAKGVVHRCLLVATFIQNQPTTISTDPSVVVLKKYLAYAY